MSDERIFTPAEGRIGAWVLAITFALTLMGLNGADFSDPSIPERPQVPDSIAQIQPAQVLGVGL